MYILVYVCMCIHRHTVAQFCVNNEGGGGRHSGEVPTILGGIQATISHPSKFGGGPSPLSPPPGIAPMHSHTHTHTLTHTYHIYIYIKLWVGLDIFFIGLIQ